MNKRWYDVEPTISMAVSFLQNTQPDFRDKTTAYFTKKLKEMHPEIVQEILHDTGGILSIFQKRKAMDRESWKMIEMLRYLSVNEKEEIGREIIRYIYCLEHDESIDNLMLLDANIAEMEIAI